MEDQTTNLNAQRASLEALGFELGFKCFFKGVLTILPLIIMLLPNYKAVERQQGVW